MNLGADLIFDLEDRFARERGVRGRHPRPIGRVDIEALATVVDGEVQPLDSPRRLIIRPNPSGYLLFFGQCEGRSASRRHSLAAGTYRMRVVSEYHQPVKRDDIIVPQGREPYFVDLEPSFRYPFPRATTLGRGRGPTLLRGAVQGSAGEGLADAVVHTEGASYDCRTDDFGQWVVVFPDTFTAQEVTLEVRLADGRAQTLADVPVEQGATRLVPTVRF